MKKNQNKKIISLMLVLILAVVAPFSVFALDPATSTGEQLVEPERSVSRGEFVDLLMKFSGLAPEGAWMVQQFSDVSPDAFYYEHLLQAKAMGIISGTGNNNFNPESYITRQDMYTIICNAMITADWTELSEGGMLLREFSDDADVSDYALLPLLTMAQIGVFEDVNGMILPKSYATFAQAADSLYNMLVKNGEPDFYEEAVLDSMVVEPDEVVAVTAITGDDPLVTWNDDGQVLVVSWHPYPDSYIEGTDMDLAHGEVWVFTDKEMLAWYGDNKDGVEDWDLRFEQLLGLPEDKEYTHFSAMWVDAESLIRPAYSYDPSGAVSDDFSLDSAVDEDFSQWFDANIKYSYFESAYPWTRLGYTYDWSSEGKARGLSEFIIPDGTSVHVEFTMTTDEFLAWMDEQAK